MTIALATTRFDYSQLPLVDASLLRTTAARIRSRTTAAVLDTGNDLLAVKDTLKHGQFGQWLDAEFGMSVSTAENYMRAADIANGLMPMSRRFGAKAPDAPAPGELASVTEDLVPFRAACGRKLGRQSATPISARCHHDAAAWRSGEGAGRGAILRHPSRPSRHHRRN